LSKLDGCQVDLPNCWSYSKKVKKNRETTVMMSFVQCWDQKTLSEESTFCQVSEDTLGKVLTLKQKLHKSYKFCENFYHHLSIFLGPMVRIKVDAPNGA
jgi:hypothetical protein